MHKSQLYSLMNIWICIHPFHYHLGQDLDDLYLPENSFVAIPSQYSEVTTIFIFITMD